MKESYDEGLANHIGPESCGGGSNAMAEALTGVRAGRVLSREILLKSRVPTSWDVAEGNIGRVVSARYVWTLRGRRPRARTETSYTGTGRSCNRHSYRDQPLSRVGPPLACLGHSLFFFAAFLEQYVQSLDHNRGRKNAAMGYVETKDLLC